jgi:NAD(P)-dependent dehydrogenase (short-subunit alcohol dehydrogenase family)
MQSLVVHVTGDERAVWPAFVLATTLLPSSAGEDSGKESHPGQRPIERTNPSARRLAHRFDTGKQATVNRESGGRCIEFRLAPHRAIPAVVVNIAGVRAGQLRRAGPVPLALQRLGGAASRQFSDRPAKKTLSPSAVEIVTRSSGCERSVIPAAMPGGRLRPAGSNPPVAGIGSGISLSRSGGRDDNGNSDTATGCRMSASAAAATAGTPRRALVTGAGGGLGREVARLLAGRGCAVAVLDINQAGADGTVALCQEAGGQSFAIRDDLTRDGAPEAAVAAVVTRWRGLDILVNNAGYGGIEPFLAMTAALWHRTLSLNVTALALATAAAGRVMREQRSGRIINVTSPASRMALPNYAAYAASKAGVDSVTRAAAVALAPFGVLVNSVAPGMMDTEMQRITEAELARIDGRNDLQAFLDERTRRVPLGRRVEPAEVAGGIVWLALDAPGYVTAERLNISGGLDKD